MKQASAVAAVLMLTLSACGGKSHDMGTMGHDHAKTTPTVAGAREITVRATNFRFDPSEIHIRAGENVTIVLTSEGSLHDFTSADGAHASAEPGRTARAGLRIDAPGEHVFYCSVPGHRAQGMEGKIIVDAGVVPIPSGSTTTAPM